MIRLDGAKATPWKNLSEDGMTVVLHKLTEPIFTPPSYFNDEWLAANKKETAEATFVDVETTGIDPEFCEIIELAAKRVLFNRITGDLLLVTASYVGYQEPKSGFVPEEITELTGIKTSDVKGHQIDWTAFESVIGPSGIIIAHNATFDRSFIDVKSKMSREKVWGCTYDLINWKALGCNSAKLEMLSVYFGRFTDAHRAMADVDMLLFILSQQREQGVTDYRNGMHELLVRARVQRLRLVASNSPFDSKNLLKAKGYSWNNAGRFWFKNVTENDLAAEKAFLKEKVYMGFDQSIAQKIPMNDLYKINMALAD